MQRIELNFNKELTKLAGNKFGKLTYDHQVLETINKNPDNDYIIVIPERIDRIASSFIQGFFESYIQNYGFQSLVKHIKIESTIEDINDLVADSLE